jgi:hypothetical protein
MLLGRVGRPEAQLGRDLGAGRGEAGIVDGLADQVEDLFLPCSELEHGLRPGLYKQTGFLYSILSSARGKWDIFEKFVVGLALVVRGVAAFHH